MIFIRERMKDPKEMEKYRELALPLVETHPLSFVSRNGPMEVLEGEPAEAVLITSFPDAEAARRWYNSPEYQAAKVHRLKAADYRVILTEPPEDQ
jgi:uncharacterized protein (DUF1330 family)